MINQRIICIEIHYKKRTNVFHVNVNKTDYLLRVNKDSNVEDVYSIEVTPTPIRRGYVPASDFVNTIEDMVDYNYIREGNLSTGDKVYIEYTPDNGFNSQDRFNNGILGLEYVVYDSQGNRRVIGISKQSDTSLQSNFKSLLGNTYKQVRKDESLVTEITDISSGNINNTGTYKDATDVFDNLMLAVVTNEGNGPFLKHNKESIQEGYYVGSVKEDTNEGFAYALVPSYNKANRELKPIKLFQKKLNQVPKLEQKIKDILKEVQERGESFKSFTEFQKIMPQDFYDIIPALNGDRTNFHPNFF